MLATQRQSTIMLVLRRQGAVRVSELADELGVSEMTIRRDLDSLAGAGLIEKVHGGATLVGGTSTYEPGFLTKSEQQRPEKAAIAATAAAMVQPAMAVGLSAGTTTWTLAQHLKSIPDITVVTNSIRVANVFHDDPGQYQTIVVTGGVRTPSDALVGPVAALGLQSMHLDLVFMGVHGIDVEAGLTTPNFLEADTDRELLRAGRRLVVLADHTKVGVIGFSSIAVLDQVDVLIIDAGLSADDEKMLHEHVRKLIIASQESSR
ncbi:MAG: DeoR/GlpR transcriptional regulator [Propionibacteriales bacterium]|nr:DeoR/GlpR transcriptional regulator [Propionibacteriales bacterium]